jgi:hypothetical protein
MARLPIPGQDDGTWGDLLNEFLGVEHNPDGTLKSSGSLGAKANDAAVVHLSGAESVAGTKTFQASPVVPTPTLGSQAANKTYVDSAVGGVTTPDATTNSKGVVQLGGDLAGTGTAAATPVISDNAITASKIATGTITNSHISSSAAIAKSKLATLNIADSDVAAGAAIAKSKLASLAIVDADVSAISEGKITNLTTDLSGKAPTSRQISTGSGLTGGGDLSADRTLTVSFGTVTTETTFGASSSSGSATTAARSDHTHGNPAHGAAQHSTIKVSDLAAPSAAVDWGGQRLSGLAPAASANDAVSKAYLTSWLPTPDQQGWLAWNYDPVYCSNASNLTTQTVAVARIVLPTAITVTNIAIYAVNAGATLTSGQSFIGLYDATGTRQAVSADQSAAWVSSGLKTVAMTTPYSAAAGTYFVALLCNGTTPMGPARTNSSGAIIANAGLTAATFRFGIAASGQTALPASFTPSSMTSGTGAIGYWCAIS